MVTEHAPCVYVYMYMCVYVCMFYAALDNFSSPGPVNNLLRKWRKRFPDPKLDPVPIWDDIITTR